MHTTTSALITALSLSLALGACGNSRAPTLYPVNLRVMNGERPLSGARIVIADHELGATDASGRFQMQTTGTEGGRVEVTVRCPEGFTSPAQPLPVTLRSLAGVDRSAQRPTIETTVQCPPSQRIAAVVVRTPGRANLPIKYQGRVITRTDAQGVAHMIFRVNVNEQLALTLDTSEQPTLRPENPVLVVNTRDGDDVYVKTQTFDEEAVRRAVVRRGPVRTGPVRIPAHRTGGGFF
jgi:hypothetical protein